MRGVEGKKGKKVEEEEEEGRGLGVNSHSSSLHGAKMILPTPEL